MSGLTRVVTARDCTNEFPIGEHKRIALSPAHTGRQSVAMAVPENQVTDHGISTPTMECFVRIVSSLLRHRDTLYGIANV